MEVLQVKTIEIDGYSAVVVGGEKSTKKLQRKNLSGRFGIIRELPGEFEGIEKGASIDVSIMEGLKKVAITSVSKGRGFAGVIKRHKFSRGPETHGSTHHREPGSVGMCAKPGKVLKGKKLPGHYGNRQITRRNVELVMVDKEKGLIALKGAVAGATKGIVIIKEQ
jgi:large subunit ribosomal protein L3